MVAKDFTRSYSNCPKSVRVHSRYLHLDSCAEYGDELYHDVVQIHILAVTFRICSHAWASFAAAHVCILRKPRQGPAFQFTLAMVPALPLYELQYPKRPIYGYRLLNEVSWLAIVKVRYRINHHFLEQSSSRPLYCRAWRCFDMHLSIQRLARFALSFSWIQSYHNSVAWECRPYGLSTSWQLLSYFWRLQWSLADAK